MLLNKCTFVLALLWVCSALSAETQKPFDAAAAFGARPGVTGLSLSPDGKSVAYIAPTQGQGSVLVTMRLDGAAATPKKALIADGKPGRLEHCAWVSSDRLVCLVYALVKDPANVAGFLPVTRGSVRGRLPSAMCWTRGDGSCTKAPQSSTPTGSRRPSSCSTANSTATSVSTSRNGWRHACRP